MKAVMKHVVWKFTLEEYEGQQGISVPQGSRPLKVDYQNGDLTIWMLCPIPSQGYVRMELLVCWTGREHEGLEKARYVGSATSDSQPLVWHVFEVLP